MHFRTYLPIFVAIAAVTACKPSRKDLLAQVESLQGELDTTKKSAQAKEKTLQNRIDELEMEIADRDKTIAALEADKSTMEGELAELREEQAKRRKELETYKSLFARLKKLIDAGTIKVVFRKGRMIVQLASAVLFDSGQTKLKDAGKAALDELTDAFQSINDRDLLVAGHTDNVPIRGGRFKSNWDLSTARAVQVVNYMIEKGFPAQHLGASGFGEFDPVGDNETEEGRANNRRIEIMIMPNLGELKGIEEMLK